MEGKWKCEVCPGVQSNGKIRKTFAHTSSFCMQSLEFVCEWMQEEKNLDFSEIEAIRIESYHFSTDSLTFFIIEIMDVSGFNRVMTWL